MKPTSMPASREKISGDDLADKIQSKALLDAAQKKKTDPAHIADQAESHFWDEGSLAVENKGQRGEPFAFFRPALTIPDDALEQAGHFFSYLRKTAATPAGSLVAEGTSLWLAETLKLNAEEDLPPRPDQIKRGFIDKSKALVSFVPLPALLEIARCAAPVFLDILHYHINFLFCSGVLSAENMKRIKARHSAIVLSRERAIFRSDKTLERLLRSLRPAEAEDEIACLSSQNVVDNIRDAFYSLKHRKELPRKLLLYFVLQTLRERSHEKRTRESAAELLASRKGIFRLLYSLLALLCAAPKKEPLLLRFKRLSEKSRLAAHAQLFLVELVASLEPPLEPRMFRALTQIGTLLVDSLVWKEQNPPCPVILERTYPSAAIPLYSCAQNSPEILWHFVQRYAFAHLERLSNFFAIDSHEKEMAKHLLCFIFRKTETHAILACYGLPALVSFGVYAVLLKRRIRLTSLEMASAYALIAEAPLDGTAPAAFEAAYRETRSLLQQEMKSATDELFLQEEAPNEPITVENIGVFLQTEEEREKEFFFKSNMR